MVMVHIKQLFLTLIVMTTAAANAGIYKWTDEQGNVHFGDRPTSNQAEQIKLRKQPKSSSSTSNTTQPKVTQQQLLNMYQQEREKKKAEKKKQKEEAKKLALKCAQARDNLRQYEGSRLYEVLPNGERRYFSEEERTSTISNLRKNIKRYCK
jgi:CRISPR/Cas system CSM-associated protein Csm2 small subunit